MRSNRVGPLTFDYKVEMASQSDDQRFREPGESLRSRNSLNVVCKLFRTIAPASTALRSRRVLVLVITIVPSSGNMRYLAMSETLRAHFPTRCGGTIAKVVNGLSCGGPGIAPSEISVFRVPVLRSPWRSRCCLPRFGGTIMAMVSCAGKGVRSSPSIRGQLYRPTWDGCPETC